MPGGFQTQVASQPAQAVQGAFASTNPIATFDAGPGGLIADVAGVAVGRFCWTIPPTDPNGSAQVATQANGAGNVAGFLYNDLQALNTVFLSDGSMVIPQGLAVALATQGDFWVKNDGTAFASVGQKAYATYGNGAVSFAASGAPSVTATATGSTIAPETNSFTGAIVNDVLTVTGAVTGTIYAGTLIAGTNVPSGIYIASQISGTAGGDGTYLLSSSLQRSVAAEAITGSYGLFTVGTLTTTPTFAVGQTLSATGAVVAGTQITQLISGAGGSGATFAVNNNTNVTSQSISSLGNVETKYYAASSGQPGQLVKMTSWVGTNG
jgi:hypothetical protein